jgi:hypothetical protein
MNALRVILNKFPANKHCEVDAECINNFTLYVYDYFKNEGERESNIFDFSKDNLFLKINDYVLFSDEEMKNLNITINNPNKVVDDLFKHKYYSCIIEIIELYYKGPHYLFLCLTNNINENNNINTVKIILQNIIECLTYLDYLYIKFYENIFTLDINNIIINVTLNKYIEYSYSKEEYDNFFTILKNFSKLKNNNYIPNYIDGQQNMILFHDAVYTHARNGNPVIEVEPTIVGEINNENNITDAVANEITDNNNGIVVAERNTYPDDYNNEIYHNFIRHAIEINNDDVNAINDENNTADEISNEITNSNDENPVNAINENLVNAINENPVNAINENPVNAINENTVNNSRISRFLQRLTRRANNVTPYENRVNVNTERNSIVPAFTQWSNSRRIRPSNRGGNKNKHTKKYNTTKIHKNKKTQTSNKKNTKLKHKT